MKIHHALPGEQEMSVTVSTFPSLNSFNSRSWVLAAIILLHLGFFWVLSSGLAIRIFEPLRPPTQYVPLDDIKPQPQKREIVIESVSQFERAIPVPPVPTTVHSENEDVIKGVEVFDPPPPASVGPATHTPVIAQPGIDPRLGLSEPVYPSQEIRLGHTGTVVLAVQVLENGRVGEVRIEQSSGFPRLDDAAVRQATRWRLKPGTRDGVPVVMWKQIPITFRLKE
jgi:protein TonB